MQCRLLHESTATMCQSGSEFHPALIYSFKITQSKPSFILKERKKKINLLSQDLKFNSGVGNVEG